jgi:N-acyl-D-amino-acid deacylase
MLREPTRSHSRRRFCRDGLLTLSALALAAPRGAKALPMSLDPSHPLAGFDHEMEQFMRVRGVPGGALAVVKDRRLVYASGYGLADQEAHTAARPDSLFRIASVSKPITGVAVLQLVEQGRLSLDTPAFGLLRLKPVLEAGKQPDPRLAQITVRQLLEHSGGWDRDQSFDPMFRPKLIADTVGVPAPAGPEAVIRYMLGQPLDFDPGTRYAYSNFGYCVLGRIIERVSGYSYATYVKRHVLKPAGITRMRIGHSLESGRAEGEVRYSMTDGRTSPSVFPEHPGEVPAPYGGFYLEAMDAHGGWIASAVDLARFAAALDDPAQSPLLKPETAALMVVPPPPPVSRKEDGSLADSYYACGWSVRPVKDGKANYWHTGSLPGTATLLVRRWDGLSWAALFNQRSEKKELSDGDIDPALHRAAATVTEWPEEDLFSRYR